MNDEKGMKKQAADNQKPQNPVEAVPPSLPVSPTPPDTSAIDSLRELVPSAKASPDSSVLAEKPPQKISKKYEEARELKVKNDRAESDQHLKEEALHRLFRLLGWETAVIFLLAFLQGFGYWYKFNIDQWTLRVIITATLTQIAGMLLIAIRHLFPERKEE